MGDGPIREDGQPFAPAFGYNTSPASIALKHSLAFAKLQGMSTMAADLSELFRANVRNRLDAIGISQADLAKRLGVTRSFVSQMLSGHRRPGLDTLQTFADALDCKPADLLGAPKKSRAVATA